MINIPKDKSTPPPSSDESTQLASSTGGVNITVPVFVPTQVVPPVLSGETLDTTNTCQNSNFPSRRKRKPWSAQEDRSLFDAVQICGEGNWANISKGDFKGERTASQLSQVNYISLTYGFMLNFIKNSINYSYIDEIIVITRGGALLRSVIQTQI